MGEIWSKTYISLHVKYPLFLSGYNETSIFSKDFREKKDTQISNFIKIHPVEAELFHADRRTDRHDEAKSHFPPFCERAKRNADSTLTLIMFLRFLHVWQPTAVQLTWVTGRAWRTFQIDSDSFKEPYILRERTRFSGSLKNMRRCYVKMTA